MYTFTVIATLFLLSCSISTSITVILYFIIKKELSRRSCRLMFCMAVADLIGATFWFADILHSICPLFMIVNLYGFQAAQAWSCIIGLYLILKFSGRKIPPEIVFHFIAWGLPFIPQPFILHWHMYSKHSPPQGCWMEFGRLELMIVTLPQLLTIVLNTAFLIFICSRRRGWGFRSSDKALFLVLTCSLISSVASILQSIPNAPEIVYNVSYLFAAAQGLVNALSMRQRIVVHTVTAIYGRMFHRDLGSPSLLPPAGVTIRDFQSLPSFASAHKIRNNNNINNNYNRISAINDGNYIPNEQETENDSEPLIEVSSYNVPASPLLSKSPHRN